MSLFIFVCILIGLILVHEWGHFFAAKAFGIAVEEFAIGFPPRLFSFFKGGTLYSFNLLLLGGYVKIFGEESEKKNQLLSDSEKKRSFTHRSPWVQGAVIVAGIACNLVFAWLLLSVGYLVGLPASAGEHTMGVVQGVHTTIVYVLPGSPAEQAGIQAGDQVVKIQTATATLAPGASSSALQQFIAGHAGESIVLFVERNGVQDVFLAKPAAGIVPGHQAIGIELDDVGTLRLSLPLALVQGAILFSQMVDSTAVGLVTFFASILHGVASFSEVAGPIGIAYIGSAAVRQGFTSVLLLTALISINLAFINVLPIPGLDGGRLAFIVIEALRGRPLPERLTTNLTIASFALLLMFMVIISYHDIVRLFHF